MRAFPVESVGALVALVLVSVAAAGTALHGAGAPPATLRSLYGLAAPRQLAAARTALVLVDFQDEFFHGRLPLPRGAAAVERAAALLTWARAARGAVVIVHVHHESARADSPVLAPGSPAARIVPELEPRAGELVITKSLLGGFSRTDLHAQLQARGVDTLIIAGLMTHLAVHATASDATALGYRTIVAADAVATRALPGAAGQPAVDEATVQRAALAILADRIADVLPTDAILALPLR